LIAKLVSIILLLLSVYSLTVAVERGCSTTRQEAVIELREL